MEKKLILGILAVFAVVLFSGCAEDSGDSGTAESIEVIYSYHGGFSFEFHSITIKNDGLIIIEDSPARSTEKTYESGHVSETELSELKNMVAGANVFSFEDGYNCDNRTDAPSASITFKIDGKEKTMGAYPSNCFPEALQNIIQKMKEIEENTETLPEDEPCCADNENIAVEFSSGDCDEGVDPYNPQELGIKEKNWLDDSTLEVTAYVSVNCADVIEDGDYSIDGDKITLQYFSPDCFESGGECAECMCAHELSYKFSKIVKKNYEFEIQRVYEADGDGESINCKNEASEITYNITAVSECVECDAGDENWGKYQCCVEGFEEYCLAENGIVRISDLHPSYTWMKGCFKKADDANEECASGADCLSGICDLGSAVNSKCTLINKEFTGEKNEFGDQEFFTATYSCSTEKPGKCTETIENRLNPGGVWHYCKMEGKTLIEIQESGSIS